jgi:hypothetical protein
MRETNPHFIRIGDNMAVVGLTISFAALYQLAKYCGGTIYL